MAYCTYAEDVHPRTAKFDARDAPEEANGLPATTPSLTECTALIEQIAQEIDGRLRKRGITTPVVDPEGVTLLLPINAVGAAAAILRSAFPQEQGIGGDRGAAAGLERSYQDSLQEIDDGLIDKDSVKDSNVTDGFPHHHHHHHAGYGGRCHAGYRGPC